LSPKSPQWPHLRSTFFVVCGLPMPPTVPGAGRSATRCEVGGFLGRTAGLYQHGDPVGFVMAVVGSIALLLLYRLISRRA